MLRGMGAALALPWLESLSGVARGATATAGKPPVRMCFWYVPNGVHLPAWFPKSEGTLVELRVAPAAGVRPRLAQLLPRPRAQHRARQRRQRRLRPRPGGRELPDRRPGVQ